MVFTPGSPVRWWLLWAAIPYGFIASVRARCYERGWFERQKLPVPVFSIGNVTLGGTGKTPIVIWLTELLQAEGKRVAILSRGYRRTSREPMLVVSDGERLLTGPEEAGDEPYLIAKRCPKAVVAVGADRFEVGRMVLNRLCVDCMVLDDGFQHLRLHRDVNLLLVDATDPDGLQAVVPAGRLREPLSAAARATEIVITRAEDVAQVSEVTQRLHRAIGCRVEPGEARFRPEGLYSIKTGVMHPPSWCRGKRVLLCSGIGHAGSFRSLSEGMGLSVVEEIRYVDHHHYTPVDIDSLRKKINEVKADLVVTTEKDAGKIEPLLSPGDDNWWAVRLTTEWAAGEDRLRSVILESLAGRQVTSRA